MGVLSLRARLVLALAYVLVLAIGSMLVPLVRSVRDRVNAEIGPLRMDAGARRVWLDGEELQLSRKEYDLLAELVAHAGEVVTREDLMARVWDENWFGSTKTLDVHVGWLRRKLGDDPRSPRFVHTVRGVGFRFTGASEWVS